MSKNGLIRKFRSISQFMMSQTGQQIIKIHIFPNISRSKGNQAMKFGQLIEDKMSNDFFEKPYTKCGGEAKLIPYPFIKNQH